MGIRIRPTDIEVPEDDPFKYDLFGRREPAEVLTRLVDNLDEGPCVLAVDAAWGTGKTTFLKIWAQHLRNQEFPVVEFNAWENDFSEDPFVALTTELTEGLRQYGKLEAKIEATKKVAEEFILRAGLGAIRVASAGVVDLAPLMQEKEDRLTAHKNTQELVRKFGTTLQDMAKELSARAGHPLVVAIDELDRCRPSYAVELLEVAKHLFAVDRIVFVLAVNLDQLAHSVRALYGSDFDAKGYLRRFVDVDFFLPEPDRDVFIREQLRATEIADYFDKSPSGEKHRAMLRNFLGASNLSLRNAGQAICRLGLLFASLRSDQHDYALATTVALILRTIDPDLYHRFCRSEATDLDVVKTIFGRPSLKTLQHEEWGTVFESTIVLAALEDKIPNMSLPEIEDTTLYSPKPIRTRLLDYYLSRQQTDREVREKGGDAEIQERVSEGKHAERVFDKVRQEIQHAIQSGQGQIGFREAVERLELLTDRQSDLHENALRTVQLSISSTPVPPFRSS